jgi:hypothetical protein
LIRIAKYLPVTLRSLYIKKASSVCQLYQLHNVVVPANYLGNVDKCAEILCSIMDGEDAKGLHELIEIGTLLSLSTAEILIQCITYAVQKEQVAKVEEVIG